MGRVLVIDDCPTVHKAIDRALKPLQVDLEHVFDGKRGLASVQQRPPQVILLDFMMPEMNGYQVCKALGQKDNLDDIPVVLMTTKGDMMNDNLVKAMGIVDYISKPFSPDALAAVVGRALALSGTRHRALQYVNRPLLNTDQGDVAQIPEANAKLALRGNLDLLPAPEVFQLLRYQNHSGVLHLAHGSAHLEVFLKKGFVVHAKAAGVDEEYLLGRYLLELEALDEEALSQALRTRRSGMLLGEELIVKGLISQRQLVSALADQTAELVYEVIRWTNGRFAFYSMADLPANALESGQELAIDMVLMEGFRRVDEWAVIETEITDFDVVLHLSKDDPAIVNRVELDLEEWHILGLVNGRRTVRDIVRESKRSSFDTCRILYRLISAKLVQKTEPVTGEPSEPDNREFQQ